MRRELNNTPWVARVYIARTRNLHAMDQFIPAYGLDPSDHVNGPQCSATPDFCFFCQFETDPSTAGTDCDLHGSLKQLVNHLGESDKEIPVIVDTVSSAFNSTVRPHISWTSPSGVTIDGPEWTKDSIRRHLLHSNEFSGLFKSVIRQMFHSIIANQNETMFDRETGMVVDGHRIAFLQTVQGYRQFLDASRGKHAKGGKNR